MHLADLPRVILRRWYVVVVGLLATAGLCAVTFEHVPPTFTASAEILLLPPKSSVPSGANPYLFLGGLEVAGDILAKAMSAEFSGLYLQSIGISSEITIGLDAGAAAPMLLVNAQDVSPAKALKTLDLVLSRTPGALNAVQSMAKAPSNALITSAVLTRPEAPVRSIKSVIRAIGIVGAGGIFATLLAAATVDAFLIRRARDSRHAHRGVRAHRQQRRDHLRQDSVGDDEGGPDLDGGHPVSDEDASLIACDQDDVGGKPPTHVLTVTGQ